MKTFVFPVSLDHEKDGRWSAACPSLIGCATWGATKELALRNIQEAVQAYVVDVLEAGERLSASATILHEPTVTVTI